MKAANTNKDAPGRMGPVKPAVFYILFALADGDKHGYAIMQETVKLSDGGFRMGPATLYTNIQRLQACGLIKEAPGGGPEGQDARRRCYRLTSQGRTAMELELERMRKVLRRAHGFPPATKATH
jgi:DNA-binding PadR family transcriptional regulator